MDVRGRHRARREQATSSVEYVGVAVAVALLAGGVVVGMRGGGGAIGGGVADRIGELVTDGEASWSWRTTREVRRGDGEQPARVSRDELRLSPFLPPVALWARGWQGSGAVAGADARAELTACALCASHEWSHEFGPMARRDGDGEGFAGLGAGIQGSARLALASIDAAAGLDRRWSGGRARIEARARGTIGGEAEVGAELRADRSGVVIEGEAGAMAGAVVRAEARAGVELLGFALDQSGHVEGWAGAGAKGAAGVRYEQGAFSWKFGWGAALGLGGAAEWEGRLDASRASPTHRRLARDALVTSLRLSGLQVPYVVPLP